MSLPVRFQVLTWADVDMPRWNHDGIARPYWRLYANDQPGWSVQWRGGTHALDPDAVVLIAPETRYTGLSRGPSRHRFLHATAAGAGLDLPPGIWSFSRDAVFSQLLARRGPWAALAVLNHAFAALPAEVWSPVSGSAVVTAALRYLQGCTDASVAVEDLSTVAGCLPHTLVRRFRAETGLTPHAWHLRYRIAQACLDLEGTTEPIEIIAERFGFCDRHHFTRTFRRWRGVAPAAYRRMAATVGTSTVPWS